MYKLKAGEDLRAGDIVAVDSRGLAVRGVPPMGKATEDVVYGRPVSITFSGFMQFDALTLWEFRKTEVRHLIKKLETTWTKLYGRSR